MIPEALLAGCGGLAVAVLAAAVCRHLLAPRYHRLRRLAARESFPRNPWAERLRLHWGQARLRRLARRGGWDAASAARFSTFLDLLNVCVDGGMNLHQAFLAASPHVPGRLGGELARVRAELERGRPLGDVLDDLAARLPVEEVQAFVRLMKRAQRLGTPVGDGLRQAARWMRQRRRQRLDRDLGLLPLKLTLVTLCFFLPPILVFLLVPAVLTFAGSG